MDIKYIEFETSDFKTYRVDKNNLLECNLFTKVLPVEDCIENQGTIFVPLVQNLLLIIKSYNKLRDFDNKKFNINNQDITSISIIYQNNSKKCGYVNLTSNFNNDNQKNYLDEDRLYISIDEEI